MPNLKTAYNSLLMASENSGLDTLKSLGLDPSMLDIQDIERIEKVAKELKITPGSKMDPNKVISAMRKSGIDIDGLIKRMKGNIQPKMSKRVKRNDICSCQSGLKFKKCCGK